MTPGETGIRALYDAGRYLQAWRVACEDWGPVATWHRGPDPVIAGCLAAQLGGPRLGTAIHLRAGRESREDPEVRYFFTLGVLHRRGAMAAWELYREQRRLEDAPEELRADWLSLGAQTLCAFRDFAASEALLDEAESLVPDYAWLKIQRSGLYVAQDRIEEAWVCARQSLELRPWFRPAVQMAVSVLLHRDRASEALALLDDAERKLESCIVSAMRADLLRDRGEHAAARIAVERYAQRAPLLDREMRRWLWAQRGELAYLCGDIEEAKRWARESGEPIHLGFAERLETLTPEDRRRRLLPVHFVRQHHMTCAPATLTALCRYWSMPGEHLEVAEEICYDGTPTHSERQWAETHGFFVREFTVDWETSVALIDCGIPFTLTTVDPGNAHLQAVVGYDTARRSLLIRDSNINFIIEIGVEELIQRYRVNGPRGMAMVPEEKRGVLEELRLPDAHHYDRYHALQLSLHRHHRDEAMATLAAQEREDGEHRLTLHARLSVAAYDENVPAQLAAAEALLVRYPDDLNLLLYRLGLATEVMRRSERIALLRRHCDETTAGPVLWPLLADVLAEDARERDEARDLVRRALRRRAPDAPSCHVLASIEWSRHHMEQAYELYRFAACLDDKRERYVQVLFTAARHLNRTEELLELLRHRVRQLGARSSLPAGTLAGALIQLGRVDEAFGVLEEGLAARPDDTVMQLLAARIFADFGETEKASRLLQDAKGLSHSVAWERTAAEIAARAGASGEALGHWRAVLELDPLAIDAHRAVAVLLAETGSPSAAIAHLQGALSEHPCNVSLREALVETLREETPAAREHAARDFVDIVPENAWARRELVLALIEQRRLEDARLEMEMARELDPDSPSSFNVAAALQEAAGRPAQARAALREAIQVSVDESHAISNLVRLCEGSEERRRSLRWVAGELKRQVTFGDGLFAWHAQAAGILVPVEILEILRAFLEVREDLWHAWSAVIDQLREMDRLGEAEELAQRATERFPLVARLWLDLADVHHARDASRPESEALRRSLRIDPNLDFAISRLARLHQREGQIDDAFSVVDEALARRPRHVLLQILAAELRWSSGDRQEALDRIQRTLEIEPSEEGAWELLGEWAPQEGQPELAEELARRLTRERAGEVRSWLILARTLSGFGHLEERLEALDQALTLDPQCVEACELKAMILAEAHRFEEARSACRDGRWGDRPPLVLRGRDAWMDLVRGHIVEAGEALEALVEEEPRYEWGWWLLQQIASHQEDHERFRRLAEAMSQRLPTSPAALMWRAEVHLHEGERDDAIAKLERAVILAPEAFSAGERLFALHLEEGRLEDAERVLERVGPHLRRASRSMWRIRLEAHRGDEPAALALLKDLCLDVTMEPEDLETAIRTLREKGADDALALTLKEATRHERAHPTCGRLVVAHLAENRRWEDCESVLESLSTEQELWALAASEYLERLADADRHAAVRSFIESHREPLQHHLATWGSVAYAFSREGRADEIITWMRGWKERSGVRPWMLLNLALAHRVKNRDQRARSVHQGALALDPDHTTMHHASWLAHDAALTGDLEAARQLLDRVDTSVDDEFYRFLIALIQALLAASPSAAHPLAAARAQLRAARDIYSGLRKSRISRDCWRRSVAAIGRRTGLRGRLWALLARW